MNVVFIFNEYSLHNQIITDYAAARPADQISIVKVPLVVKGKSRSASAQKILPQLPARFIVAKIVECIGLVVLTAMPKILSKGAIFRRLRSIALGVKAPFVTVDNIMSPESLAFIKTQDPDIVFTLFHQIVKQPLIDIPRLGVINAHPGLLPQFRGIQPYFWNLAEGFPHSGATLHFIEDENIDTGRILAQGSFATWPQLSVQLNYHLTAKTISQMLPLVAGLLESGTSAPKPQSGEGTYYRWPTQEAMKKLVASGHRIVDLRQLWHILSGQYDNFEADQITCWTSSGVTITRVAEK